MATTSKLDTIRTEHATGTYTRYGKAHRDIGFLISTIHLLEQQIEAQLLASVDPDNCTCITEIIDDAGSTIVSNYDPACPIHQRNH